VDITFDMKVQARKGSDDMSRPLRRIFAISAICVSAAGCTSFAGHTETAPDADKIAVYESQPPSHRSYVLVKRLWVASWASAGWVPSYQSVAEAAADFRSQAVALGGDAVMNFNCCRYDATIPLESNPKLFCNGNIIKYP
jgi:hypothetical protein